jgi:hypothetical protein
MAVVLLDNEQSLPNMIGAIDTAPNNPEVKASQSQDNSTVSKVFSFLAHVRLLYIVAISSALLLQ